MRAQPTPEPWTASPVRLGADGDVECWTVKRVWTAEDGRRTTRFIADVPLTKGEPVDVAEANARLIAAAPTMLSALQAIMNDECPRGLTGGDIVAVRALEDIHDLALTAIAKATAP